MATLFWPPSKMAIHFLVKKPSLILSPRSYGQSFFGPLVTILTGFHCITCQLSRVIQNCPWYGTNLQVFCRSANLPDEDEFWVLCALVCKLVDYSPKLWNVFYHSMVSMAFLDVFSSLTRPSRQKSKFWYSELHVRLCVMSWAIPMCHNLGLGRFVLVEGVGGQGGSKKGVVDVCKVRQKRRSPDFKLFSRGWHVWKLIFPLPYEKTPAVVFKVGNVSCLGRHSSIVL